MSKSRLLVFTDLDGSLLDHHNYSFAPALPMIKKLEELAIPLIPTTSKTMAELLELRKSLHNDHPFITENGAAVFIPKGYFKDQPEGTVDSGAFWVKGFAPYRAEWQKVLTSIPVDLQTCFKSFSDLGDEGIAEATGLTLESASFANMRDYSEPLLWQGNETDLNTLKSLLSKQNIELLAGGRFVHLSTGYNKGKAMQWLANCYEVYRYEVHQSVQVKTLALGDGGNDVPMLDVADFSVVIRPADMKPVQTKACNQWVSEKSGPEGWNEMVHMILINNNYIT